jgi:hypothetical protein
VGGTLHKKAEILAGKVLAVAQITTKVAFLVQFRDCGDTRGCATARIPRRERNRISALGKRPSGGVR